MSEEENNKTSKYNSAIAQLIRLDSLWQRCHLSSLRGNYNAWSIALDKIWVELSADLGQLDRKHKTYYEMVNELNKTGPIALPDYQGFKASTGNALQYSLLIKREQWLKSLQNELGKGTKWADADDDMM